MRNVEIAAGYRSNAGVKSVSSIAWLFECIETIQFAGRNALRSRSLSHVSRESIISCIASENSPIETIAFAGISPCFER